MRSLVALAGLTVWLLSFGTIAGEEEAWSFADWRNDRESAEEFLRSAAVVSSEEIPVGISRPLKLTLEHAGVRAAASFKTIDVYEPKMEFDDGTFELNFRDTYKSEMAAYELDKLLDLDLVPPTVERRVDGRLGALRLWIEGAMTEAERREGNLQAPDPTAWSNEVAAVRILFNLTSNSDFNNIRNLLVDSDFRICAIDHSRAFRTQKRLVAETMLMRFSRDLLVRLEALDQETLTAHLDDWLSKSQIKALLKRRDLILARADKLVALKGEALVLFD